MFQGGGAPRKPPPISGATSSILEALSALTSNPYEDSDPSSQEPTAQSTSSSTSNLNLDPSSESTAAFINVSNQYSLNNNSEATAMSDSNQSNTSIQTPTNPLEDMSSDETQPSTTENSTPIILSVSSLKDQVESVSSNEDQPVGSDNTSSSNVDTTGSSLQGGLSSSSSSTTKSKLLNRSNEIQKAGLQTNETSSETDSSTIDMIINGVQFFIGDFVYVKPPISPSNKSPLRQIVNLERTWVTSDGDQMVRCTNYFRPMETSHKPTRKFFKKEVFQTDVSTIYHLSDVIEKCYVLGMNNYFTKTLEGPEHIKESNIYVCEYRYSEKYRYFKKIAMGSLTLNEKIKLIERSVPHEMIRVDASETEEEKPQISSISSQQLTITSGNTRSPIHKLPPVAAAADTEDPLCLPDPVTYLTNKPTLSHGISHDTGQKLRPGRPRKNLQSFVAHGFEAASKIESNNEKTFNLRSLRPGGAAEKEKELRVNLKRIDIKATEEVIILDAEKDESNKKRKRRGSGSKDNVEDNSLSEDDDSEDTDFDSDSGKEYSDGELGRKKKAPRNTRYTRGANSTFRCDTCNANFEDQALLEIHAQVHHDEEDEFSPPDGGGGDMEWFGSGSSKRKLKHRFTIEAQYALLNSLLIHREEILAAKTIRDKTELFKTVARELKDQQDGELTTKRCMDKWNNLLYQQKNYSRTKNVGGVRKPNFYDEMEQILNNTPLPKNKRVPIRTTYDDEDLPSIANSAQSNSKGNERGKYRPSLKTVTLSYDDDDSPSIANSAQSKVNKEGHSESARLLRASSPTVLSDSPVISAANSPSHSPSMSPPPEFTPVTIVTSRTAEHNKQRGSKASLLLPPEPQFSPPVTELIENNADVTSSSIMLPPPPQFSPPVTNERGSLRDPLLTSEGILRAVPLSSLTAPAESLSVSASSSATNSISQSAGPFVPPPLLAASLLANQFQVGPLSHAVSQSLATHTLPDNTVTAGQGPRHSGTTLLISQSGLANQARIPDGQLNKMNPHILPANKRSNTSRQSQGKSSTTNSSTERNLTRNLQNSEARPRTSLETMSENVGGIFDMCKQHLQLYKEEIELRRRSTKALERQAKIQEQRLKEERKHRSRFVALMENHGRNQNREKDFENGGV